VLDGVAFVLAGGAATWLALLILTEGLALDWRALLLIPFWAIVAYLALPRVHRVLTYLYLPNYFIGRSRTSDGLLGDPVNLAVRGDEGQVHAVMKRSGWVRADEVTLASSSRIVTTTLRRVSYPEAPVSPLHLFQRAQDFAYQQEVAGSPSQRHHVRFWRCPPGWLLPGGTRWTGSPPARTTGPGTVAGTPADAVRGVRGRGPRAAVPGRRRGPGAVR